MKNELDSKFVLRVFDKIRQEGEEQEGKYRLEGVVAYTDFDGYTLYINDAKVAMQFGFHNQYHFDYQKSDDFDDFEKKLRYIDEYLRGKDGFDTSFISLGVRYNFN